MGTLLKAGNLIVLKWHYKKHKPIPTWFWMMFAFMAGFFCCAILLGNDLHAAVIDRQQFATSEWHNLYYFSTQHYDVKQRPLVESILRFTLASASKQQLVEHCSPVQVGPTLYRVDTRLMKWDAKQTAIVFQRSHYRRTFSKYAHLVNHPGWFIAEVTDTTQSNAYYQLLYGTEKLSRNDFLKFHKANTNPTNQISYAEAESGVSVSRHRWLMNFDNAIRTDVWGTLDFFKITSATDPTNNLLYTARTWQEKPRHDGEEWIAGLPKISVVSNQRGRLQAYLLSAGDGDRVEEAPPRLVDDWTRFRGHHAIVNVGSCIACHRKGLQQVTANAVRQYLSSGATIKTYAKDQQEQIELLVLQAVQPLIERANEEYAVGCQIVCGLAPEKVSEGLQQVVSLYDDDVTLDTAAREQYTTVEEIKLAISWRDVTYGDANALQTKLAAGIPIPRTAWEDIYTPTAVLLKQWRESIK